jgi:uncharacterized protein (AIM24 family)
VANYLASSQPHRTYTCPWCTTVSDGTQLTCPGCGISIDVRNIVTDSGWIELPGRRDMTKLQFGNSYCQIEGSYVPVADFNLAPEDQVYFAHHVLLWMDPQVKIGAMGLKGAWKRMLAGMPLIMTQAQGPGHIAFSRDAPGELIALPLQPGQGVDVREHIFLVATSHVTYDWFQTNIWFTTKNGDDTETHYPLGVFMDRFVAPQAPGLLLLHASGNAFIRLLAPGDKYVGAVAFLVAPPPLAPPLWPRPRGSPVGLRAHGGERQKHHRPLRRDPAAMVKQRGGLLSSAAPSQASCHRRNPCHGSSTSSSSWTNQVARSSIVSPRADRAIFASDRR